MRRLSEMRCHSRKFGHQNSMRSLNERGNLFESHSLFIFYYLWLSVGKIASLSRSDRPSKEEPERPDFKLANWHLASHGTMAMCWTSSESGCSVEWSSCKLSTHLLSMWTVNLDRTSSIAELCWRTLGTLRRRLIDGQTNRFLYQKDLQSISSSKQLLQEGARHLKTLLFETFLFSLRIAAKHSSKLPAELLAVATGERPPFSGRREKVEMIKNWVKPDRE